MTEAGADQLQAILEDFEIDAIKIGMLHNTEIIECVSSHLRSHPHLPIVLDPVMVSTSGDALIADDALNAMSRLLSPCDTSYTQSQ